MKILCRSRIFASAIINLMRHPWEDEYMPVKKLFTLTGIHQAEIDHLQTSVMLFRCKAYTQLCRS